MRTILTFVGGGDRDQVILQTALAAATPLAGHLDCLHVHVPASQAARYASTEFASGAALRNALHELGTNANLFSELAATNVREFCARATIEWCDTPTAGRGVTARFREEQTNTPERLTFHARHSDLVVIGRARQKQGLAPDTLEHLVSHCGRPVLVAATAAPQTITDTVMVCWNESAQAARAVTAATPLLARAKRVVFVGVTEPGDEASDGLDDLARQFAWTGVRAEIRVVGASRRDVPGALCAAADQCGADLVVMGAYGRSRVREFISGSCTDAVVDGSDRPILLMH